MPGSWTRARAVLDSDNKVKPCKNSENIGVYKFTITEDIPYPKKRGRVIYIGKSESKSIYKRIETSKQGQILVYVIISNYQKSMLVLGLLLLQTNVRFGSMMKFFPIRTNTEHILQRI